jgi:hypothetical protein
MMVDGWTWEEAWEEAQAYGFNVLWIGLKSKLIDYAQLKGVYDRPGY